MNRKSSRGLFAAVVLVSAAVATASGASYVMSDNPYAWRYGNWGGAGYSNGSEGGNAFGGAVPVDRMDEAFRQHDRDIAEANNRWAPQYRAARTNAERVRILALWAEQFRVANTRCVARVAVLPPLLVRADGSDTWGGRHVPKSRAWREAFKLSAAAGINFNFPRP